MRQVTTSVYQFDELSDTAKERARAWWRDNLETHDYADSVIEDAVRMGEILGITIDTHAVKLIGGSTRQDPSVWWSGFSSQGDGASFDGRYAYHKGSVAAIAKEAPMSDGKGGQQNADLNQIAADLYAIQRSHFYQVNARIKADSLGHYGDEEAHDDTANAVMECMRDFASWVYRGLELEYEYQSADEQVDETIRVNEYEFDEDGDRV